MQVERDESTFIERTELSCLKVHLTDCVEMTYDAEYKCYKTGGKLTHVSFERIIAGGHLNALMEDWNLASGENLLFGYTPKIWPHLTYKYLYM